MRNAVAAILTIGLVASLASVGVVTASPGNGGVAGTADIGAIVSSPGDWLGDEVTVWGLVAFATQKWFVLCGNEGPSITVKTTGDTPAKGAVVSVEGTAHLGQPSGSEQAYLFARSWEYLR